MSGFVVGMKGGKITAPDKPAAWLATNAAKWSDVAADDRDPHTHMTRAIKAAKFGRNPRLRWVRQSADKAPLMQWALVSTTLANATELTPDSLHVRAWAQCGVDGAMSVDARGTDDGLKHGADLIKEYDRRTGNLGQPEIRLMFDDIVGRHMKGIKFLDGVWYVPDSGTTRDDVCLLERFMDEVFGARASWYETQSGTVEKDMRHAILEEYDEIKLEIERLMERSKETGRQVRTDAVRNLVADIGSAMGRIDSVRFATQIHLKDCEDKFNLLRTTANNLIMGR